jgi:hypothetical protein
MNLIQNYRQQKKYDIKHQLTKTIIQSLIFKIAYTFDRLNVKSSNGQTASLDNELFSVIRYKGILNDNRFIFVIKEYQNLEGIVIFWDGKLTGRDKMPKIKALTPNLVLTSTDKFGDFVNLESQIIERLNQLTTTREVYENGGNDE